jgi:hypothetical protein
MITSSQILSINSQIDGRKYVIESHTDSELGVLLYSYLGPANVDTNAVMLARAEAYNAHEEAAPTFNITNDDDIVTSIKGYLLTKNFNLKLTSSQKTAVNTTINVLNAIRPLLRIFRSLSVAKQNQILEHTPILANLLTALEDTNGS